MAGTLSLKIYGTLVNGEQSLAFGSNTADSVVQTGQGTHAGVAVVGTSEEDLGIGDISTLGYLYIKNLDSTNFITYGPKSGGVMIDFGRLRAGEHAVIRLEPGITLRWVADTANVKVEFLLMEA